MSGEATVTASTSLPERLDDAAVHTPLIDASPARALFRMPGVARYLVSATHPMVVDPDSDATDADVACFRDTPVRALELLLRGTFSLRAAAVEIDGRAVVICGASATGKSALAAELARRGHRVLADKVVPVRCDGGAPEVIPGPCEVELWPRMAKQLGFAGAPSRPVRPALAKRAYRVDHVGDHRAAASDQGDPATGAPATRSATKPHSCVPLGLVLWLTIDPRPDAPEHVTVDRGTTKARSLLGAEWHRRLFEPLGLGLAHFDWFTTIAAATPMGRLTRPRHGFTVAALADEVEAWRR